MLNAPILLGFQKTGIKSLLSLITEEITSNQYTRISACAAYASYRGVVLARKSLSRIGRPQFRWLFGLDDYITDPQALKVAKGIYNSEVRIVPVVQGRRFHAKAYLLDLSAKGSATLIVGSANLTEAALTKNCEGYILVRATTEEDVNSLRTYWEQFWQLGKTATDEIISEYQERHRVRKFRPTEVEEERTYTNLPKGAKLVAETVDSSKLAWIELGYNTGGGNQLDIVKKLARFLDLPTNPEEGLTEYLTFNSPLGRQQFQVTFTKGMWRFMNLQQGFRRKLRPDLTQPSPYVLLISRQKDDTVPSLSIQHVGGKDTERMISESKTNGFIDFSVKGNSGRRFGWF